MPTAVPALLADLARAFPRQQVTPDTVRVYARELADLPPDALERAVRVLIRTAEFFPTIRAIREAVAEDALALPSEAEALAQIEARVAWARRDEADRDAEPPPIHPLVREALDHVGGWPAFRAASRPEFLRRDLLDLYREMRAVAVRGHQTGGLPAAPARRELPPAA